MNHVISDDVTRSSSHAHNAVIVTDSSSSDVSTSLLRRENVLVGSVERDFLIPYPGFVFFNDEPEVSAKRNTEITVKAIRSIGFGLRMRRPLCYQITKEDDEYRAEIPQVELYSFAKSATEAVEELCSEFIDLCSVLFRESNEKLSQKTLTWKLFLQQFVAPDAE